MKKISSSTALGWIEGCISAINHIFPKFDRINYSIIVMFGQNGSNHLNQNECYSNNSYQSSMNRCLPIYPVFSPIFYRFVKEKKLWLHSKNTVFPFPKEEFCFGSLHDHSTEISITIKKMRKCFLDRRSIGGGCNHSNSRLD